MENIETYQQTELEALGGISGKRTLVYIPISKLSPHPDNPRKDLGDLTEMAESIKTNGVMQNLTVVPNIQTTDEYDRLLDSDEKFSEAYRNHAISHALDGGYTVVIGHRRLAASELAGLPELPCVVASMTYKEQITTMMTENAQRVDLTVFEQAQCFRQMTMDLGMSVDTIAKQTGFSSATVRRRLKLCEYDQETLKEVSGRQISMTDFEQLEKIDDLKLRNKALKEIGTANFNRECAVAMDEEAKRKKREEWRSVLTEAGMTEIKQKEAEDTIKYTRVAYLYGDDRSRAAIEQYLTKDRELCFYVNQYGYAVIVTPKSEKDQNEASQKDAKRKQEEAARLEARAGLKEAFERAYRLRCAFIKNYKDMDAKRNLIRILEMAINTNVIRENGVNMTDFCLLAGYREQELEEMQRYPSAGEIFNKTKSGMYQLILSFVYAAAGDSEDLYAFNYSSWQGAIGEYSPNDQLTAIYESLKPLGYEMSDEERELLDGTSSLYYRPEPKKPAPAEEHHEEPAEEPLELPDEEILDSVAEIAAYVKDHPDGQKTWFDYLKGLTDEELDKAFPEVSKAALIAVANAETVEEMADGMETWFCAPDTACHGGNCADCITAWLRKPYEEGRLLRYV